MDRNIRFLTIFTPCENVHLIKDIGMIPYVLYKEFNYESTVASYNNGDYPYLETDVKGLKQVFIKQVFKSNFLNLLNFIFFNFKKFDVLQVYDFSIKQLFLLYIFKVLNFRNPEARVYLKMDVNDSIRSWKFTRVKEFIYKILLKKIDLVSLESKKLHEFAITQDIFKNVVKYIPNGFYDYGVRKDVDYADKENLIITVGRIGSFEKNNEVLLEGFKEFSKLNDKWKLEIIGPIEESFNTYIDEFMNNNPDLTDKISFTGPISDRKALNYKYKRAKIFVLTSISEGFPLVFLEAIKSGCMVVSTDLNTAYDVTDNARLGGIFPIGNHIELSKVLNEKVNAEEKLFQDCVSIQNFAYENFYWKNICHNIITFMNVKVIKEL
ncbi:glycosyltransferase involved in cell wall biosynthesis [Flavobacterium sp. HSC-32F16]|uniref:glycosyltransferase family 4 protein n=1 Tax=Flavobacterium sp. HSC-32F16 TaxID=2910964 RepID=UPI0020A52A38|nr:glycosyltransferase [Flavobacterium sp. HSC-32F16]MCP2029202.1 glycosyltransferase involved in cell wall biosynthesis [Flavobacterium sp. HSC-32F16]